MSDTGPWLSTALFCQRAYQNKDGTYTYEQALDLLNVDARGPVVPAAMPTGTIAICLYLMFVRDQALGRVDVAIRHTLPSGAQTDHPSFPVSFAMEHRLLPVWIDLPPIPTIEGVHWFDVRVDGHLMTRVPLELRYRFLATGG